MHLTWFLLLRKFPSWALTLEVNIISQVYPCPALLCRVLFTDVTGVPAPPAPAPHYPGPESD